MNYVKEILYKYLTPDLISLVALEEKQDDTRWMIEKGYKTDFVVNFKGMHVGGELTKKGEQFLDECDKKFRKLFPKVENLPPKNETKAKEQLLKFMEKNPNINIYHGLTDDEKRMCDRLLKTY